MKNEKRHKQLLDKIKKNKPLSAKELKELANFESASKVPGVVSTQAEVARVFKVSVRTVRYWVQDGMPTTNEGQYDLTDIQAWRLMLQGRGGRRKEGTDGDEEGRTDWETEYRKFKALLAEIDYNKAIREVIPKEEVEKGRVARVLAVRRALLALPRTLAPQLIGLEPREIESALMGRIREIIIKFAEGEMLKEGKKAKRKKKRKRRKAS